MAERRSFQDRQYEFAAHIRDPEHMPAPAGIEDRRMAIYRELFFNNLRNLLGTMFPVLRKLHSDEHWRYLIRQFMRQHESRTPYFLQLPQEFLKFLQDEYEPRSDDFPFLLELAHYEYIELALSVSTAADDFTHVDPGGDLLESPPVKSVLAEVYAYQYPVQRISGEFLPTVPLERPVCLAVYRGSDDKVRFLELNEVTASLVKAIETNSLARSGRELLRQIAADIEYPDVDALINHGANTLAEMRALEILIGTQIVNNRKIADEQD